ncbi:N-acetyltransferase family protein [Leisingera sp. S232]|uniref:GNAT family N-acetyltransferase n=1 Tax=Leisingera sp. S232 TaxID=3415132 RepID=UPI003C79ADC7
MTCSTRRKTVRPAKPDDGSSLAALSIEVWLGTYLHQGVSGFFADYVLEHYTPEHFAAALKNPAERLLVSQNQDGIDGYIRISHNRPSPAGRGSNTEISTLYVQPRHHSTGTGRSLLDAGLQTCRSCGWDAPWLATNSGNSGAIGFYLRNGFEQVGLTQFRIGDAEYPNDVLQYSTL